MKKNYVFAALVVAVLTLVGCGAPKTLEQIYSQPQVKQQMDQEMASLQAQMSDLYSNITFEATGNDITFNYYIVPGITAKDVNVNLISSSLDAQKDVYLNEYKTQAGVEDVTITFNYILSDGSTLLSKTIK